MAQVEVDDGRLVIRLDRSDRLWAFRSELAVPLDHVSGVEVDGPAATAAIRQAIGGAAG